MKLEMRRNVAIAVVSGAVWLGAGPAAAQTDDDCYPVPEDGCVDEDAVPDGGVLGEAGSDEATTTPAPVDAVDAVEATEVRGGVLARTGGVVGTLVLGALAAVLLGLVFLATGGRRRRA